MEKATLLWSMGPEACGTLNTPEPGASLITPQAVWGTSTPADSCTHSGPSVSRVPGDVEEKHKFHLHHGWSWG